MAEVVRGESLVIANGQTTSNAIDMQDTCLVGLEMPGTFTGTSLTFLASFDGRGTYKQVTKIDGTAYTVVVAADKYISIPPADIASVRRLKVVSSAAEGGARTIIPIKRQVA